MSAASNKDRCYAQKLTVEFYEHDGCQIVNFDQHSDENCTIRRDDHGGKYSNCPGALICFFKTQSEGRTFGILRSGFLSAD